MDAALTDVADAMRNSRRVLLWKLEDLDEYDLRRPLTPTATNLLGIVKHLSTVQALYLGFMFGRPLPDPPSWMTPAMPVGDDLWVRAEETSDGVRQLFARASAHADETLAVVPADAAVDVPWAPFLGEGASLHRVAVHVLTEFYRHAGHADVVRELIDATVGNLPGQLELGPARGAVHREDVERAARDAG